MRSLQQGLNLNHQQAKAAPVARPIDFFYGS
jgi:hypothetical protein